MGVIINEIKNSYKILLHKVNEVAICELPFSCLNSISNSINEVGQIELTVDKYYINHVTKEQMEYPYYSELQTERMISLDDAMYVIKSVKEDTKGLSKHITAYSKEKKLEKVTISVEDLGFYLQGEEEESDIFNLEDYMYDETGWKFGQIDDDVKYNADGSPKMRWQESVDTSWLDYLKTKVSTQFGCYVHFDNVNQKINLYNADSYGENLNIELSYDNYLKSLEKISSSSDIVTKMKLIGNEDSCVISDYTVDGLDYIENYSYFIENKEMSEELISALELFYSVVAERAVTWKQLRENKLAYQSELLEKQMRDLVVLTNISVLKSNHEFYNKKAGSDADTTGTYTELLADTIAELDKYQSEHNTLDREIRDLETQIDATNKAIYDINISCRKKSAMDNNERKIFSDELLDELKKFVYLETFSDDAYYNAEEMIADGEKRLSLLCRPTKTWEIDVEDFTSRIIDNGFRQHWKGQLGLGDIICLYDVENDTEEFIYLVGYSKDYKNNSLSLTLSNKKESQDVIRYINDWLKIVKANNKIMTRNKRLWNAQKGNRINIDRDEVK